MSILADKKIIIYGSGINAQSFIEAHRDESEIVCCIDRYRVSGACCGIPIYMWDDIAPNMADCIVIAANDKHIREIYFRIIFDCDRNELEIYDWRMTNLRAAYRYAKMPPEFVKFFEKNRRKALLDEIDNHDAISFDMFDTLVMRPTVSPEDMFDYIDCQLEEDSKVKGCFKQTRKLCEIESDAAVSGYPCIYERMKELTDMSEMEIRRISDFEVKCEKELIVCRDGMKEIFEYALMKGKKVYIVSDMYFSKDILAEILKNCGIVGYSDIFVSSEYRKTKRRGLFEIFKNSVSGEKFLHIGDDDEADGQNAEACGIDSFIVPSGVSLLRSSDLRGVLYYAKGGLNRRIIGELISTIFNDPFCLCGSCGKVDIVTCRGIGESIVAPIVYLYLHNVEKRIESNNYDKVLLGARDGFIFDRILHELSDEIDESRYCYLYISRILAYKLGMGDEVVNKDYENYVKLDPRRKIDDDMDFVAGDVDVPYKKTKEAYWKYLSENSIDDRGRYLFCDLISGGTVQHSILPLFRNGIEGFYLGRTHSYANRVLKYTSIYAKNDFPLNQLMIDRLEMLISSDEPSVIDIDSDCNFVFAKETRKQEDMMTLRKIQAEIVKGTIKIREMGKIYKSEIDRMLPVKLLMLMDYMSMSGEIAQLRDWVYEDINGERVKVFD